MLGFGQAINDAQTRLYFIKECLDNVCLSVDDLWVTGLEAIGEGAKAVMVRVDDGK